jgi:hypothetical protein
LGPARDASCAFFDGFGAIGGRSLPRGKASRRVYDYVEEFRDQDLSSTSSAKIYNYVEFAGSDYLSGKHADAEHFAD